MTESNMSETIEEILSAFKAKHSYLLDLPNYSLGFGLDPDKKGPKGFIIYAMSNDLAERSKLILSAKKTLARHPQENGIDSIPVYFKGIPSMPI